MRAAWFESYGPPARVLQVGERPVAAPSASEVRVRVHASGVNPSDVKKRAGAQPALEAGWVIPHSDGAGVIEAVGEGLPASRVGERVWVYQAQYQRRFGTAAEYVTLPVERVAALPDSASFAVGACLGIPAMTAHRCVFADGPVAGKTVLVTGAGGRVGYYAVQFARHAGATVVATAGRCESIEAAREAGAHAVIDYHAEDLTAAVKDAAGGGVDRVVEVEFGMNLDTTVAVVRPGATVATYSSSRAPQPTLPFYPLMFKDVTVRFVLVYAMPEAAKQAAIADIGVALREGWLRHRVARRFDLSEIAAAHDAVESGAVDGCVVVDIA